MSDDDLRVLFDIAIHSLDFGSGFLDDAEVEALRRVAVSLGVDPMEATPEKFSSKYPHHFVLLHPRNPNYCGQCGPHGPDASWHLSANGSAAPPTDPES